MVTYDVPYFLYFFDGDSTRSHIHEKVRAMIEYFAVETKTFHDIIRTPVLNTIRGINVQMLEQIGRIETRPGSR